MHTNRLILLAILITAICTMFFYKSSINIELLILWFGKSTLLGAVLFTLLFAVTTVLLFPGLFFTLAGGVLFGPFLGTLLNLTGATIGAGISFLIARYIASDWLVDKNEGRIRQLIDGAEKEGWKFVAFVRLVPIVPFFILNYALGITRIKFSTYLFTTFISLIPSVAAITYIGHIGREAMDNSQSLAQKSLIGIGLTAIAILLPLILKKRVLKSEIQE